MRILRPLFLFATATIVAASCLAHPAIVRAQDARQIVPAPQTVNDLGVAFKWIDWDSKAHGLLLAIAPEKVGGVNDEDTPPDDGDSTVSNDDATKPLFVPTGRYGLNAGLVARHFKRKLIRLPTIAASHRQP